MADPYFRFVDRGINKNDDAMLGFELPPRPDLA